MRMIDAEALAEQIKKEKEELANSDPLLVGLCVAEAYIDDAPTVEPKKGYWYPLTSCANEGIYCSVCQKKVYRIDYSRTMKTRSKFCPNCGAEMSGVRKI